MIRKAAVLALAAAGLALTSAGASAYQCRATSPAAWGQGWHTHSLGYAQRRALGECAARTPYHQVCRIVWCR
ncbi:MAG: hypothetical protein NW223_02800 [Hyphomicrobiaceae bacterium]|nr:hypothetical protein [Hyphomicrobiaceae bacterium]